MMTALNIGYPTYASNSNSSSYSHLSRGELKSEVYEISNTSDQVAKGQRVMTALQKMYEIKLILQIKESKRASQMIKTEVGKLKRTESHPWEPLGAGLIDFFLVIFILYI
jgi:hypothetical protein